LYGQALSQSDKLFRRYTSSDTAYIIFHTQ